MVPARISYKSSFDFPIAYVDTITIYDKIALRPVSFSALTYQIVLLVLRSGCLYRQLKHLANESHLVRQFVFGFTIGLIDIYIDVGPRRLLEQQEQHKRVFSTIYLFAQTCLYTRTFYRDCTYIEAQARA